MINKGAQSLPQKDANAYKTLAKMYDQKNYKKGLKNAGKLLETHPDHPETHALKALFQLALGEQNKALQSAKSAVMKSKMKSTFCWHTYGTVYKQKKDFAEAVKCFQFALKNDAQNLQILRQTAHLQIQVRDHTSHVASLYTLLKAKPNQIQNWASFTLAHHLRGDYPSLFKSLASFDNLVKSIEMKPVQLAKYYLYRIVAFKDAQKYDLAYEQLKKNKDKIFDQVMWLQLMFKACVKLDKKKEAEESIELLLKKFPQNNDYLRRYQKLLSLSDRECCQQAVTKFNSKIARVYELSYISDAVQFKKEFAIFIKPYYQKNLISLFAEIQRVYQAGKESLIEQVLLEYDHSLKDMKYPDGTQAESPSQYLWSMYILAQHYARHFESLQKALSYINAAINHTPTVPQFYTIKAGILYQQHNNYQSLRSINEARKTDLADRYMNNICVKYLMKIGKPNTAEIVLRMFMRDEASLYELQNQWYIIEAGKAFLYQRKFEAGLRHLNFINKQFIDMLSNEFDFHGYCVRKWTLRQYTELIEFNNNIYDDKMYMDAAGVAIKYLREYAIKVKADQQKQKEKAEEQAKVKEQETKKKKKNKHVEPVEEVLPPLQQFRKAIDYYGKEYAESIKKNPLDEALVWAKNVASVKYTNKQNPSQNKLYCLAFSQAIQIFIHYNKPLLVLRCLKKLIKTTADPYQTHQSLLRSLVYFQKWFKEGKGHEIALEIIKEFVGDILKGKSIQEFNTQAIEGWKNSVQNDKKYKLAFKAEQCKIILGGHDLATQRSHLIKLNLEYLTVLSQKDPINQADLQLLFHVVHNLQYFGELPSEIVPKLHLKFKHVTQYFSDWKDQIQKMPESTWTMWWLSDYDIEREEIEAKQEQERQKAEEKAKKEEKSKPKNAAETSNGPVEVKEQTKAN